jgi:hypothetical protein
MISPTCQTAALVATLAVLVVPPTAFAGDGIYDVPLPTFESPVTPAFVPPKSVARKFITPFPIVRIKGRLTPRGVHLTRLSVDAPAGTRVTIRCRRRGCPKRSVARTTRLLRFKQYERNLPAGVRLIVTATKPDVIGKHVLIRIRKGRVPKRLDRCLRPGERAPVTCSEV